MLNELIAKSLPIVPKAIVKSVAKRYIAGALLDDAVATSKSLEQIGAQSTIDVLGEFVTSRERASNECASSSAVLDAISKNNLQAYLSVKLTSLGLDIDDNFCYKNIVSLLDKAKDYNLFVRLDMENSPYTTKTLNLYKQLRDKGYDNVGVVIQAYMRRSEQDIKDLIQYNANVRLCKGIYIETEQIAYKEKQQIRDNYMHLLALLVDSKMKVGIATHDEELIQGAHTLVKQQGTPKELYEFQMLLGVREERRNKTIKDGHPMRIYVPFGEDWYGYSVRRLKENPQVAGHVLKAMFGLNN